MHKSVVHSVPSPGACPLGDSVFNGSLIRVWIEPVIGSLKGHVDSVITVAALEPSVAGLPLLYLARAAMVALPLLLLLPPSVAVVHHIVDGIVGHKPTR